MRILVFLLLFCIDVAKITPKIIVQKGDVIFVSYDDSITFNATALESGANGEMIKFARR